VAGPRIPKGLSPAARRWFRLLVDEYAIEDPAGLLTLEMAMRNFDRSEQARAQIDRDGPTTLDARGRPKAHPACSVERDARSGMLAALKAMNLDLEPLRDRAGRPSGM
jgi:phage terminase small subunit